MMRRTVRKDILYDHIYIPTKSTMIELKSTIVELMKGYNTEIYDTEDNLFVVVQDNDIANALSGAIKCAYYGKLLNLHEIMELKADNDFGLPDTNYMTFSEEIIGIDTEGRYVNTGEPVVVVMHNGGLLTPDRIERGYDEGLIDGSVRLTDDEFTNLLKGQLPDGRHIDMLSKENGRTKHSYQFGVVIPYESAQNTDSKYYDKDELPENPLVDARLMGCDRGVFERFFENVNVLDGLYNNHPYQDKNASIPQGRIIQINENDFSGFDCRIDGLSEARFIVKIPNYLIYKQE